MRPPRPTQGAVRAHKLKRKLTEHDAEIGVKMSATLRIWYEELIEPLEKRVAWLEMPLWKRAWKRLRGERP